MRQKKLSHVWDSLCVLPSEFFRSVFHCVQLYRIFKTAMLEEVPLNSIWFSLNNKNVSFLLNPESLFSFNLSSLAVAYINFFNFVLLKKFFKSIHVIFCWKQLKNCRTEHNKHCSVSHFFLLFRKELCLLCLTLHFCYFGLTWERSEQGDIL